CTSTSPVSRWWRSASCSSTRWSASSAGGARRSTRWRSCRVPRPGRG
ncbi:MAG: hypothetical protein AVDCRST_MAG07-464, partial [uncultured Frankineae bacterium]